MNKNDNFSLYQDPNRGGQNFGMNDLLQAQKHNLDTAADYSETPITKFDASQFLEFDGRLVADASELNNGAGDQIDIIFPGQKKIRYEMKRRIMDDGDLVGWEYASKQSPTSLNIYNN